MVAKLFVITRADLPPGVQAVQAMHAAIEFMFREPEEGRRWFEESNTVAFLVVDDEASLGVLLRRAIDGQIPVVPFREPDRGNELTSIAIGPRGKRLTQGLKLGLTERVVRQEVKASGF